jgi:uncharacterized membrane protein
LRATALGGGMGVFSFLELELELRLFIALPPFMFNLPHDNNFVARVQQTHSTQTSDTRSVVKAVVKAVVF